MACCSCVGRKGLWYFWGFNALIASIFSIIAVSHGAVLDKIIVNNKAANSILDAAIAGITCAVFLNVGYLIITALILLRKTIALNGAGAPFGFMIAFSLMMFFNQVQVRRKEYHMVLFMRFSLSLFREPAGAFFVRMFPLVAQTHTLANVLLFLLLLLLLVLHRLAFASNLSTLGSKNSSVQPPGNTGRPKTTRRTKWSSRSPTSAARCI